MTGHNLVEEEHDEETLEFVENAATYASCFFEKATKHAVELCASEGRMEVTKEDILKAMKYQFFHTDEIDLESLEETKYRLFLCEDDEGDDDDFGETEPPVAVEALQENMIASVSMFEQVDPEELTMMQRIFYGAIKQAEQA